MTINQFFEYFQYPFIVRGLLIGLLVAIIGSMLGHFLVLKKMSLIGDGLAHVAYLSVAISIVFLSQSLIFNLLLATTASLTIHYLISFNKGYSDAIIGGIATSAIALGTLIITTNPNQNVRIEQFLFGSLLLLRDLDIIAVITLAVLVVAFVGLFFNELMTLTFDQDFAKVNRLHPQRYQVGLAMLTSWLVIIGIRASGSLLISSFLIFPTLIVMNFKLGFVRSFFVGILIATFNFLIGFALSLWFDLPTGSTIVLTYSVLWLLSVSIIPILKGTQA
ncbi:MAG: metal ABC transporter permease [Firmicutes bacterium]|nr:metal ABC transporter permease [Bacillota bacterium]